MAIPDPVPEGYLPLNIAFERYHGRPHEPLGDNELINRFVHYLISGKLEVIFREPVTGERLALPQEAWKGAQFAWRSLFFNTVLGNENANDMFRPYQGRTPFVSTVQLSAILTDRVDPKRPRRGLYPWDWCQRDFLSKVEDDGAPTVDCDEDGWRTQADVERWVTDWMRERLGEKNEPSVASIRRHVSEWLTLVRLKRAG